MQYVHLGSGSYHILYHGTMNGMDSGTVSSAMGQHGRPMASYRTMGL